MSIQMSSRPLVKSGLALGMTHLMRLSWSRSSISTPQLFHGTNSRKMRLDLTPVVGLGVGRGVLRHGLDYSIVLMPAQQRLMNRPGFHAGWFV